MTEKDQTTEEFHNIDELVFRYQEGCQDSGEEIMRIFGCHPESKRMTSYIGKYHSMIRYGKFNFKDKDSRRFIALFIKDGEVRQKLTPFYQYRDTQQEVRRTLQKLSNMMAVIDDEDLQQDLRFLLLQQALRFKKTKKKVGFTGYLYNSYRFAVYNHIEKIFKPYEPLLHKSTSVISFQDDKFMESDDGIEVTDSIFAEDLMIRDNYDDELGNSWVRGLTCGEEFKDVTPLQRLILKLHFHDKVTDGKIADSMGVHINTIFRQRKKACEIIENNVERLIQEGYYQ